MYTYKIDSLQHFFDKSSDAMTIACDGVFLDCNNAAIALFEASSKEQLLSLHPSVVSPEYQQDGEKSKDKADRIFKVVGSFGNHRFEWQHKTLNGRIFWVDINMTLIVTADGKELQYAVLRDITVAKEQEKALQELHLTLESKIESRTLELQLTQAQLIQSEKMSSLGQLVAGIAHEINNPVSFIYSNIEPALAYIEDLFNIIDSCNCNYNDTDSDLDFLREDLPKLLNSMKFGSERIKQIVLSLRNFSRADEAPIKEVNIHEGIDSTLMILGHKLKLTSCGKKINIIKNYGEFEAIECYPSQLNQVFMNLLLNAIDAVDEVESPQIEITTDSVDEMVKVLIKDNGIGIPENLKNKIFDPFYTTKGVGKGTGLGLGISYQIMERHQGKIWCDTRLGEGTTFAIMLPIRCK